MHKKIVFIALGSNLGDRAANLDKACDSIGRIDNLEILLKSNTIETRALEILDQPNFLNSILKVETDISPFDLLERFQKIELAIGRLFRYKKGPREIDIDILDYSNISMNTEKLTLPHPAIKTRPFITELLISMNDIQALNLIST